MDEGTIPGARFWFVVLLLCVVAVVAGSVFVVIFTHLWYAWGVLGAFLAFGAGLLAFGWAYDRRERKRRERLAA